MPPTRYYLPCSKCGHQFSFLEREHKRNANLTVICTNCGTVNLAFNAVKVWLYQEMKKRGHTIRDPFVPDPIDPVTILASKNGFETVIRRYKNGMEAVYTRRARKLPKGS